ncbi:hypothetical protein M407DRAFT_32495 [Tulasnella calospora MUT 4182]|uniref:N-acetyltransferase domain-containing protein n=1 Tax=Tulasnella calospora MUT 4182 TaxID=1051891 RepID=A0A0C3PSY3_9AGAM|nr:hypothetical protein M407DRAFT_32495 [Tulasnella calospora MUT 4182]
MVESKQQVDLRVISNQVGARPTPRSEGSTSPDIQLRPWVVVPEPSEADIEELKKQRIACGWHSERIPMWKEEIQSGTRYVWFIHTRTPTGLTETAGMISLYLYDPSDLSVADMRAPPPQAGGRVEIGALFIYPEYRRQGIAEAAFRELEQKAAEVGATTITVNTMAPSETVRRYERIGYQQYKKEKKYKLQDVLGLGLTEEYCYAAFLEKKIA